MIKLSRIYEELIKEFTKDGDVDYDMYERYLNFIEGFYIYFYMKIMKIIHYICHGD
jgi:hypothetical protein